MDVRRLASVLGASLWAIAAAEVQSQTTTAPGRPTAFEARPLYDGTTNSVFLVWHSGGSADSFHLERRVTALSAGGDCDSGGSWSRVASPPGSARSQVDTVTLGRDRVCYRLRGRNSYGASPWTYTSWIWAIGAVNWPPVGSGSPSILHNYGTGYTEVGSTMVFLHPGLDLLAPEDSEVRVVRGGVITGCAVAAPRWIRLEVQVGPNADDVVNDYYVHMWDDSCCPDCGTVVSAGTLLGELDDDTPSGVSSDASHLHYEIQTAIDNNSIETTLNPLSLLSGPSQDTHQQDVSMADTAGDSKSFQIVESPHSNVDSCRNNTPLCETNFTFLAVAAGDVDLIADVSDLMSSNASLRVAPYEIEAWVTQVTGGTATIGSSANPMSRLTLLSGELGKFNRGCVVSAEHEATMGAMARWPTHLSWVVTNWVSDGSSTDDNRYCQFWRTKAKVGGAEITGSDAAEAVSNGEARFPDGRYRLQLRARDLRQTVGPTAYEFVVDNFQPSIDRFRISTPLYDLFVRRWTWSSASYPRVIEDVSAGAGSGGLSLTIEFSEPVTQATIGCVATVNRPGSCVLGPYALTAVGSGEKMAWTLDLPASTVLARGSYSFEVRAVDLAGNPLSVTLSGRVAP